MKQILLYLTIPAISFSQNFSHQEISMYKKQAQHVTIIRDNWGTPHIYGKTDADAVFGLMYAQCEENFQRVEENYLEMMGRLSEVYGEAQLYNDLEMRLIYDSAAAMNDYKKSPAWFQKLLNAFADGVNYFLLKHPEVRPAVLTRFEPWFPLMRTDGSIAATQTGGLTLPEIKNFYSPGGTSSTTKTDTSGLFDQFDPTGSNGFAIGPQKTASKNAILYINPHVTFYFRTEVQMVSDEGLNAYGAVTWGQFFVYQGFNEHCGWMHTSSYSDVSDLYEEKVIKKDNSLFYRYDNELRPVKSKKMVINYKKDNSIRQLPVTIYYTHHGPVMGSRNGKWLSLKENNRSLSALMQSWLRTKAKSFAEFKKIMEMRSNNSNNTVYADDKGNIAYWHGNFMPKRDPSLNWSMPVDGSISATEWKGLHELDEIVHLYNPASGWIENCNSTPFTASGSSSPVKNDYPAYMAPDGQNARALNAIRLLSSENDFTVDKIITAGYDHFLSAFDILLPSLFRAYDEIQPTDPMATELKEPIQILKLWDRYSSTSSVATTLGVEWAYKLIAKMPGPKTPEEASNSIGRFNAVVSATSAKEKLELLSEAIHDLESKFGSWKIAWGEVNRYQRTMGLTGNKFDDDKPSLPVGMASSTWGSLPAFEGRRFNDSKRRYGVSGNSFIAAVEFGKKVKAKSVITGGQSFDPSSKHFTDQAPLYIEGKFKDVLFYREDVLKHVEEKYHPGE